jgi:predicted aspartyl protease
MPYPFDSQFVLPFPRLPVAIRKIASTDTTSEITALIDTGADATLVPKSFLEHIQADELYATRIRSHWGEWRAVTVYVVDLVVVGENLPAIEVIADEHGDVVLLGRNVLTVDSAIGWTRSTVRCVSTSSIEIMSPEACR